MKMADLRGVFVAKVAAYAGFPIIEADQNAPKPDGPHATYKFTTAYAKDAGMPDVTAYEDGSGQFYVKQDKVIRTTVSFTAYAMDNDASYDLAQSIRDWFDFIGVEDMQAAGIAVIDMTGVDNRDAFVVDDYERRNGFDVILRHGQELLISSTYIETVDITKN